MSQASESAKTVDDEAATASPWQFRLWHLFAAMSYVAGCAAIARYLGPGTLMMTLGLGVALLNLAGCFTKLQRGRRQRLLLGMAWVTFLVSLCLPTFRVFGTAYGWEAAWIVLVSPWERIMKGEFHPGILLWIADSVANLLQAALPLLMWRLARDRGQRLSSALLVVMVAPWFTIWPEMSMLVGYYVWCASFYLSLLALPVQRTTYAGMLLVALGSILLLLFENSA